MSKNTSQQDSKNYILSKKIICNTTHHHENVDLVGECRLSLTVEKSGNQGFPRTYNVLHIISLG